MGEPFDAKLFSEELTRMKTNSSGAKARSIAGLTARLKSCPPAHKKIFERVATGGN
jgi:hypothetical protein